MMFFATPIADKRGHVFNQTEQRNVHPLEHINAFAGVHQCNVLRGRDHNRPGNIEFLAQGHLNIAGSRWQIHQQHIEPSPLHLIHHLLQGAHQHRPTPDNGLIIRRHQPERHQRYAMIAQGQNGTAIRAGRTAGNTQHARLARAVHIGVKKTNLETF